MGWTIISAQYEKTQDLRRFGYPQIAFIWLYTVGYQIAWVGAMAAYGWEIMPYNLRAKASLIFALGIRILGILGRYVEFESANGCISSPNVVPTHSYTNPIAWDNLSAAGHAWVLAMIYTVRLLPLLASSLFFLFSFLHHNQLSDGL